MSEIVEVWKDIIGYEGCYKISNYGNVRSLDRIVFYKNGRKDIKIGKEMKKTLDHSGGYYRFNASKKGVVKFLAIHVEVAKIFIPNIDNKPQVNHIDCNKTNNFYKNLEWVTIRENIHHAVRNKIHNFGETHGNSLLTDKEAMEIYKLATETNKTMVDIAKNYKVTMHTVYRIKNKLQWRHIHGE